MLRGRWGSGLSVIMTLTVVYPCNTKLCILGDIHCLHSYLKVIICAAVFVATSTHPGFFLYLQNLIEAAGALRAFGYVVQQWTAAAHFEQDNDGCWIAHSN